MKTFWTTSSASQWRVCLKGGDEFDALTGWRRVITFKGEKGTGSRDGIAAGCGMQ